VFGVHVPEDAEPGVYQGHVKLGEERVQVSLRVTSEPPRNRAITICGGIPGSAGSIRPSAWMMTGEAYTP